MCNKGYSSSKGTWFEKDKITLLQSLQLIFCWCCGTLVSEASKMVGVSVKTTILYYKKIRKLCIAILELNSTEVGGKDVIVEIDESHIYKAKHNKGRVLKGQATWIVGGVERKSDKAFMVMSKKRDKKTLNRIVTNWVLPGSIIYTDKWSGYNDLPKLGYQHFTVNHSTNFLNPEDQTINTQKVERFWRSVKDSVPKGANGDDKDDHYFSYLFKRGFLKQSSEGKKFRIMLNHIKKHYPGMVNQKNNQINISLN